MSQPFTHRRRVEFSETDMAGIVHFAHFFRYMESAEHAFFRSLGLSVHGAFGERLIGWPRVSASCDYIAPLRFEDEFEVGVVVAAIKPRSLVFEHAFRKLGEGEPPIVARGRVTTVCVALDQQTGQMKAVPIPDEMVAAIRNAQGLDSPKETA